MADDFSVSAGTSSTHARSHRHSPFDDILTLEQAEEQRLHAALAAMEAAERDEAVTLEQRLQQRSDDARAKAREELLRFKEQELPAQLQTAENDGAAQRAKVEKAAGTKKATVVASLVERMLSNDILSRL